MNTQTTTALEAAREYTRRGWRVVPVPVGKKKAVLDGWPKLRLAEDDLAEHFKGAMNVGILTGEPSGGLVDADCDVPEAIAAAALFLPPTDRIHGRPSNRRSHYWFRVTEAMKTAKFQFPEGGAADKDQTMYIELRASTLQTLVPPSLHPDGEHYTWDRDGEPAEIDPQSLLAAAAKVAACVILARHWPKQGTRDDTALALAGMLERGGWSAEDTDQFVTEVARIAGDEEWVKRAKAERTATKIAEGAETTGAPRLMELLRDGEAVVAKVRRWLGLSASTMSGDVPYFEHAGGLWWKKPSKEAPSGVVNTALTNFTARIVADVTEDDGAETRRQFEIEATLHGRRHRFTVPSERFAGMCWATESMGAMAALSPGFNTKDHARYAIQVMSGDVPARHTYTHTGWRKIGDSWAYLHGGGAIGPEGTRAGVSVALPGDLAGFVLPDPPRGDALRTAVRASLRFLAVAADRVTIPQYAASMRAALGEADCSVHVAGQTGEGKSELAALVQQHYGPALDARRLPGSWASTGNALEAIAFAAKDALLVVDDFNPQGSTTDVQRMHRDADRLLRAQGNHAGRGRMRPDATLRPAKPPRGLILSTGEDIPRGHSLRARMLVVELSPGDVNWDLLTACQRDAADGIYAQAFAGYVSWLALRHEERRHALRAKVAELRAKATQSEMHRRTPEIVANLALGMETFLGFARSVGAITQEEEAALVERTWAALGDVAKRQQQHQAASEPARRFLELLNAAIASGEAHVALPGGGKPGTDETPWGWQSVTVGTVQYARYDWEAQGKCVGWIDGENLYIEPDAAYAIAQKLAQAGGDSLGVSQQTLWKRMHERHLLASTDERRQTHKVRRQCAGQQRNVIHVTVKTLSTYKPPDKPDIAHNDDGESAEDRAVMSGSAVGKSGHNQNPTANPTAPAAREISRQRSNVGFVGSGVGRETIHNSDPPTDANGLSGSQGLRPQNPTTNPTTKPDNEPGEMVVEVEDADPAA